jgi:flagellar motor switch protein FliM
MNATAETLQPNPTAADVPERDAAKPAASTPRTFRQDGLLGEVASRKLRGQQEEFARRLAARLSDYLRVEFSVTVAGVQTISFQRFVGRIGTPAHVTLLKIEPLQGIGLLEIPPRLGLGIVDRQLGGTGKVENTDRALTEIETALLDQVSEMLLGEWCSQWRELQELKSSLLGHEIDVRFLNAIPRETVMLELSFETVMGETKVPFRIGFPFHSIESLINRQADNQDTSVGALRAETPRIPRWNPQFDDVPINLTASYNGLHLTTRALAVLKAGDTLALDPQALQEVQIRLGTKTKFIGTLGTSDSHWAVQLIQKSEA